MIANQIDGPVEEKLITQAANGDFEAFERLLNHYRRALWQFVFRLLANREDANDAIQQILLQVYHSLPSLESPARFRPWLFTIARNKCFDQLRQRRPIAFSDLAARPNGGDQDAEWEGGPQFPDPAPLPDEIVERAETRQLLQQAIAALPERPRQVVALRYTTDLSFAEIAQVLGMNENSVKTLFQRAKAQLRFYLHQHL